MGIKDKLVGMMFEEGRPEPTAVTAVTLPPMPLSVSPSPPTPSSYGIYDQAAYRHLAECTQVSQVPEFGQLQRALDTLEAFIPDPKTRMQAALAQVRTAGVDTSKLLQAFDQALGRLQQEKAAFGKQLDAQRVEQIDQRQAEVRDLQQKLEQAQSAVVQLKDRLDNVQRLVEAGRGKLEAAAKGFEGAYQQRQQEIQKQRAEFVSVMT